GSRKFDPIEKKYQDVIELRLGNEVGDNENIKAVFRPATLNNEVKQVFKPGNEVKITGIGREGSNSGKKKTRKVKPYIEVISYQHKKRRKGLEDFSTAEIQNVKDKVEDFGEPFYRFAHSLAPHVKDAEVAKEVIAASLIGSPEIENRTDGRIHSMILSNPGLGKTDLQTYVEETFQNTYFSDGGNATGVGLTGTVEEVNGQWTLKAGKLVYAHKGVLSIDEFDKMDKEDAARINTAMVNPTFTIDKAGINASLQGQATVIATGNFEEYLDDKDMQAIKDYLPDHVASVMDRFDLKYALKSTNSEAVKDEILGLNGDDNP
ncbi:MAG: ATP-binding protein, partial [Candidatus Aenigmatarchaeota archaeon]